MINAIPLIGWLIDLALSMSLAVPFWIIWTDYGIGRKFFYFLPEVYLSPGFWECVSIFIVAPIVKKLITPTFVSVSQTNKEAS